MILFAIRNKRTGHFVALTRGVEFSANLPRVWVSEKTVTRWFEDYKYNYKCEIVKMDIICTPILT